MALHKDLIELIDKRIKEFLNTYVSITDKEGSITGLQNSDGKYTVKIDGIQYEISKKDNDSTSYQVNDVVLIKLSNGNFSRKYIECKKIKW